MRGSACIRCSVHATELLHRVCAAGTGLPVFGEMVSVERLLSYAGLAAEKTSNPTSVGPEWPRVGEIELRDVRMAYREKLDLAIAVALGSSTQIALFVIPLMVVIGWVLPGLDNDMTLDFPPFETTVTMLSVRARIRPASRMNQILRTWGSSSS